MGGTLDTIRWSAHYIMHGNGNLFFIWCVIWCIHLALTDMRKFWGYAGVHIHSTGGIFFCYTVGEEDLGEGGKDARYAKTFPSRNQFFLFPHKTFSIVQKLFLKKIDFMLRVRQKVVAR